jgi:DNA-directed RNA polymerase III subunit RPC2
LANLRSSSTHGGLKSKTYVATKKGKIYLRHNCIHEDVPIVIALKALGIQSDKEILLLTAGNTEAYKIAFSANLEESAKSGVFTRHQALEWIGSRVKVNRKVVGPRRPVWEEALEALATIILAHVPVIGLDFRSKAIFVATMTRRVLMAMDDEKMVDDRDYVGNKRLELYVPFLLSLSSMGHWYLVRDSYLACCSKICSKRSIPI